MKHRGRELRAAKVSTLAVAVVTGLLLWGCSDSFEGVEKPNQPPRVWLSGAPPEGSTEKYTIHLYWGGWDPDGEIAYFEYAITDNGHGSFNPADTAGADKWHKVWGNDSIFSFTADELADTNTSEMVTEFTRSHTFFIRAVDREGLATPHPDYRSFTTRTLSPKITVTVPPGRNLTPAFVPPVTTFKWVAEDYIDDLVSKIDPDSVSWILEPTSKHNRSYDETTEYIRKLPVNSRKWSKWVWYRAPADSGKSWTTAPLDFEPYVFAIRAKDEAGAITPVFDLVSNVRRIQVSKRSTGPLFTVRNIYLGAVTTAICHEPVTILDLPAGLPVSFCWEASAEHYGGIVSGYRYGWDIEDLSDPNQWEVDYTPFTATTACAPSRRFFFGTHIFSVEVIDNSGYCSRVEVKVNIVQFTMEKDIMLVDDYIEGTRLGWDDPIALGLSPNDVQHDGFWESVLENAAGFNAGGNVLQIKAGDVIPLTELARYKAIIWSAYSHVDTPELAALHEYVKFRSKNDTGGGGGKRLPNVIALFMAAGGRLLLCGNHPVSAVINRDELAISLRFPVIWLSELEGDQNAPPSENARAGDQSFAYKELCLESMDFSITSWKRRRNPGQVICPVNLVRVIPPDAPRVHGMRAAIPIDPDFPRLELRYEAAGEGRYYSESKRGLDVEVYNPPYFFQLCPFVPRQRDCFEPIYGLGCLDTGEPVYGQPVAFWTSTFADSLKDRSVVFGFPPVYFEPDQVRAAIETILFDTWGLPRK